MYEHVKVENRNKINAYVQGENDGRVDFYPAYIQLEQTNKCNASCIMCNHFYLGNNGASEVSEKVLDKVYSILPYCETLMLNGDGEPFLCSNIVENIRRYAEYEVKIGTNTNFGYVPEECFELIRDSFGFLNISCDGASKEVFELIRRGLSYDKFISNLKKLCTIAPTLPRNLDCVLMRQNLDETSDIVRLAAEYGFKSVRFHRMGVNPCIGNEADSDLNFAVYANARMEEATELADKLGIQIQKPGYPANMLGDKECSYISEDIEQMQKLIDIRRNEAVDKFGHLSLAMDYYSEPVTDRDFSENIWSEGKACQWATERVYIDLNGNVTTCCFNMRKHMGNLSDNSFDDIWNGDNYVLLRKLMAKNCLPEFCKSCNWIKDSKF